MKVGTDGVLLGAWCDVAGKKNVLDVGTGTGLIALMVAQRSQPATIDAIEIDEAAYYEACYNIENSPWSERISVVHIDFSDLCDKEKKYDLIVSNPPYFTNGILPPDGKRKIARHCETLTFDKLITHSVTLLSENGIICLITPADAENKITSIVVRNGLNIEKKTVVYPKTGSVPCGEPELSVVQAGLSVTVISVLGCSAAIAGEESITVMIAPAAAMSSSFFCFTSHVPS